MAGNRRRCLSASCKFNGAVSQASPEIVGYLIDNAPATFFIRMEGFSMVEHGFQPGDILVVDRAIDPKDSHIVVAFVGGERLCKQLRIQVDGAYLVAGHPDFPGVKMGEGGVIWGVVTGRFARVRV